MPTLVTKEARTVGEYADHIYRMRNRRSLFQSKETRDAVAARLKADGHSLKKESVRNQCLHPEAVVDFVGSYEMGFGNTDYQTQWGVLYVIVMTTFGEE